MPNPEAEDVRLLLVEDHALVRAGLRLLLEGQAPYVIAGEAAERSQALALAAREQPDIILLDLHLGGDNSTEWLEELCSVAPHSRVILLTAEADVAQHSRAIALGACGVVLKEQAAGVLLEAIESVRRDQVWMEPSMMARVLAELRGAEPPPDPEAAKIAALSPREREIVALVGQGLKNREIAERLFLSETTVRHHLTSAFHKLHVADRLELVIYAYRNGLMKVG
jgi:DNA-binding NarL/FixJ family response regulator